MISDLFSVIAPKVAAPLRAGEYQTLMADPPWLERGGGQIKRGADRHYPLMSTRDICLLPVRQWAGPNAHLYLWVTNNFLPDGLEVMAAWGFRYVTKIDWFKSSDPNDAIAEGSALDAADRDLQIGLGQYFRGCTESCLFGVRGTLPYRTRPDGKRAQGRTGFHAPREQHSRKPEKMRQMVELVSPGPYLELFARRPAQGWDVWGNEAT
jgi:N6-adenosine-specific RNA methylase IME4